MPGDNRLFESLFEAYLTSKKLSIRALNLKQVGKLCVGLLTERWHVHEMVYSILEYQTATLVLFKNERT